MNTRLCRANSNDLGSVVVISFRRHSGFTGVVVRCAVSLRSFDAFCSCHHPVSCRLPITCERWPALRVLVSNDDGVDAPGIRALAEGLRSAGHEVLMVAPDRDRSGASNSLTLDGPVRVVQLDEHTWRVHGTPTDCVHVAITGMLDAEPDIVVSGINNTANLGDDVIYSGTVAAAMEGRFLGLPAIAISLCTVDHDGRHYHTAARAAVELIARLITDPLPADTILNVNVPDLDWGEITGFEVTRLGNRHRSEACIPQNDPRGRTWWWIGAAGAEQDAGPGTDFHAIRTGHISISPIHVDLTRYQALDQVASWVNGLEGVMTHSRSSA